MKQIVLTVEDNSLVPKLKAAVKMLHMRAARMQIVRFKN